MDDIPDFLRIPQADRRAAWVGRKLTRVKPGDIKVARNEDAGTRAFRREIEKQEAAKKKLKYQLLRERYGKR